MPVSHWTYREVNPQDDLCQGDILEPTDKLRSLFNEVHPHFTDRKYLAFLILTQTCDLARRRRQECDSRYINLAVVRSFESTLFLLLDGVCDKISEGLYVKETKGKARQLLERVFNQNEQKMGLFYLHPDADVGIAEPSVALLKVSIAVRSREHYETLQMARTGGLSKTFQCKLGWLIGNLYSRVATQDWERKELKHLVNQFLSPQASDAGPDWFSKASKESAESAGVQLGLLPKSEAIVALDEHKPKPPVETAINAVVRVLEEVAPELGPAKTKLIQHRLRNTQLFRESVQR